MNTKLLKSIKIAVITCLFPVVSQAQIYSVEVTAGAFDRLHSIVSFYLPADFEPGEYHLQSENDENTILQVDEKNRAWFILDELASGGSKRYILNSDQKIEDLSVYSLNYELDENTITLKTGSSRVLSYYHGENNPPDVLDERYRRGGYIHPVYSPAGIILTNHLNVDQHPHHSGIWSAWTNTVFEGRTPDFWNVHLNSGRVDVDNGAIVPIRGSVFTGFKSNHRFADLSSPEEPEIALNEVWKVRVFQPGNGYHLFDLEATQTVNTDKPLHLPEYRYGGIGFRGHADWDVPENVTFLTAEGMNRDGHGTRTRWTHIGGRSDGVLAGIAILGHPSNYRHPQPVRIHPDEPFFNFAPQQMGDMIIEPGTPYTARYRFITYDGEPVPKLLNRLWDDYAWPPGVSVVKLNEED